MALSHQTYRISEMDRGLIERLRAHLTATDPLGRDVTTSDVLRVAVRRLAEAEGLEPGRESTPSEKRARR